VKYLPLIWRGLMRKKVRTLFTLLSISVAFILFAYLAAIDQAFNLGAEVAGADRLLTIHKVSLIQPLPLSYRSRIAAIPGVKEVCHATWFGGKYQNEENLFPVFPVDPASFMSMYPEYVLPPEQLQAWIDDRTGAVVGRQIADRYGFEIGDRVPLQGTIYRQADGGDTWEFTIRGIYDGAEPGVDETLFLFQYDFLNESREEGRDLIGWYIVRVEDPDSAARVAQAIDERFANSPYETESMPEKAFVQNFAKQIGNVGAILRAVLTAVFFTILLVAANTMAQSVRERVGELAVLKTLGFSDAKVLALVLAESLALAVLAGGIGLAVGVAMVAAGDPTGGRLPAFRFPPAAGALGAACVVALGVAAGLLPAVQAMRLRIVDALRRV
jgi:putative ABC transport system permease protein